MCKNKKKKRSEITLYDPTDKNCKLVIKFVSGILTFNKIVKSESAEMFNPLNTNE